MLRKIISLHLRQSLFNDLTELAKKNNISRTALIAYILTQFVKRQENK